MKLPRRAIPIVWTAIVLVIMALLPWAVSLIGPRYGWGEAAPAAWNTVGLAVVAAGLATYGWCLAFHYLTYDEAVDLGFDPPHLVVDGPYQYSRNPMYVAGLSAWLGWTVFYGSPAVLVALVLLWAVFSFRVIPSEERQLQAIFAEEYAAYKASVHRWLGRR